MRPYVNVIGAGLAGCEAAWQALKAGVDVRLYEMKPKKYTPAHHSPAFAELVCSNSFRSDALSNAIGLLKAEMVKLDSLIMNEAYRCRVPAGSALAVDRTVFSEGVTDKLKNMPGITVIEEELGGVPDDSVTVIATGPLTSDKMADYIRDGLGLGGLHFFDAAAPIVDASTVDETIAYRASRYGKGDADYVNCPMNESEYLAFYDALLHAECAELKEFDREDQKDLTVFEGCMPVEVMAARGIDTLRYGPLKPVGLPDPRTGKDPYAVVQLRKENVEGTMFNLVGFQTHLTFAEQRRVFRMIPGLSQAEFLRYGVMHRNTFLQSPGKLTETYALASDPHIFFAGQMTGVEGYIESAGSGLVAGLNAARTALGLSPVVFPKETMIGAMAHYVSHGGIGPFQPMNANFGIVTPLDRKVKGGKAVRNEALSARALSLIDEKIRAMEAERKGS